jgi:hypothetical protein
LRPKYLLITKLRDNITLSGRRWKTHGSSKEGGGKEAGSKEARSKEGSGKEEIIFFTQHYTFLSSIFKTVFPDTWNCSYDWLPWVIFFQTRIFCRGNIMDLLGGEPYIERSTNVRMDEKNWKNKKNLKKIIIIWFFHGTVTSMSVYLGKENKRSAPTGTRTRV